MEVPGSSCTLTFSFHPFPTLDLNKSVMNPQPKTCALFGFTDALFLRCCRKNLGIIREFWKLDDTVDPEGRGCVKGCRNSQATCEDVTQSPSTRV